MAVVTQYFKRFDYNSSQKEWDLSDLEFSVMTTDSYSDDAVLKTIQKTKKQPELFACAIQTAIVGLGNKTYGKMKLRNQIVDVKEVYNRCNVKYFETLGSKLDPGDLTPRRLQRFFRYHIKEFLEENQNISSYLFSKYSVMDFNYRTICFPGAEHLIEDKQSGLYLLHTYLRLDARLGLSISERISRVLIARNIITHLQLRKSLETFAKDNSTIESYQKFLELF